MIELIAQALKFLVLILGEIFGAVNAAKAAQAVVDASNAAFAGMVVNVLNKIGQGKYTITLIADSAVDAELKGKENPK